MLDPMTGLKLRSGQILMSGSSLIASDGFYNFCELLSLFLAIFFCLIFPPFFYISNSLHGLNGLDIKVPVVLQRLVSLFLELEHRIVDMFFIVKFACGLSPCEFSGVVLSPKVAMAFGPAKSEIFAIISHEHDSVTWVDRS